MSYGNTTAVEIQERKEARNHDIAINGLYTAIYAKGYKKDDVKTIVHKLVLEAGNFALNRLHTEQIIALHTKVNGMKDLEVYLKE